MNQLRTSRSMSGALLLAALCGLYSSLPAQAQEGARRATPPSGKALVHVFRHDNVPLAASVPVVVNTELLAELQDGTFVTATVDPGNTYLRVGDRVLSTLYIVAAANQSYFVKIVATYGLPQVRTELFLVDETEGRRSLSRLAEVPSAVVAAKQPPPAAKPSYAEPAATQPAPAPERSATREPGRDWDFAFIASAGTFKLDQNYQVVAGLNSFFDITSNSVFGVEAEWRNKDGLAMGGEAFFFKNDLTTAGANPNATQEVSVVMVNGKYYFRAASWAYPFLGGGIGMSYANYSGGLTGDAYGVAYQWMAGMEFRFKPFGLYVQYKNLTSNPGDSTKANVSGSGFLAGVSFTF